jgi:hypothetical protein
MADVERYPEISWDYYYFLGNPNITIEDVEMYPDKQWDWHELSKNPNVNLLTTCISGFNPYII